MLLRKNLFNIEDTGENVDIEHVSKAAGRRFDPLKSRQIRGPKL